MHIWVDADACPAVIKDIRGRNSDMQAVSRHEHSPDVSFDGGDLDCGNGLLLLIRKHIDCSCRGAPVPARCPPGRRQGPEILRGRSMKIRYAAAVAAWMYALPAAALDYASVLTPARPGLPLAHPIASGPIAPPPFSLIAERPVKPAYVPGLPGLPQYRMVTDDFGRKIAKYDGVFIRQSRVCRGGPRRAPSCRRYPLVAVARHAQDQLVKLAGAAGRRQGRRLDQCHAQIAAALDIAMGGQFLQGGAHGCARHPQPFGQALFIDPVARGEPLLVDIATNASGEIQTGGGTAGHIGSLMFFK
jgi:hypothetical protein